MLNRNMKRWLWPIRPHRCVYCGIKLRYKTATIDHFQPLAAKGLHNDENCLLACVKCNHIKGEHEFSSVEEARAFIRKPR